MRSRWLAGLVLHRAKRMARGNKTYPEDGQQDVEEEIRVAPALEEDTKRRQDDGGDKLAGVGTGQRHDGGIG